MSLITPLYDSLWNEYLAWSALVALFTFGWLYHHSFFYRSKDGENPNIDNLEVGVFPAENDDLKLELAWTIVPFILFVYLTYISWAPLDNVWSSPNDGYFGNECDYDSIEYQTDGSNLYFDDTDGLKGAYHANCYHIIEITAKQWVWSFDCGTLEAELCESGFTEADGRAVPHLSLQAGNAYLAYMTSEDVTHAPWFVSLGVKEDVLPGQTTTVWILAEDVEDFLLLCTEYCGDDHAYMMAGVTIHA